MKFALSMYLGGISVAATEADYDTARELGCVCSNCHAAVFLRCGSLRTTTLRNGKKITQDIAPTFVHYKFDGQTDCELRYLSKETQARAEQHKTEGRNQRLALYNRHLWEMFVEHKGLDKDKYKFLKKLMGKKVIDTQTKRAREMFTNARYSAELAMEVEAYKVSDPDIHEAEIRKFYYEGLDSIDLDSVSPEVSGIKKKIEDSIEVEINYYHKRVKTNLHLDICKEIVAFMQTKSSKYFWNKFFLSVVIFCFNTFSEQNPEIKQEFFHHFEEEVMSDEAMLVQVICLMIHSVHWIDQIDKRISTKKFQLSKAA